MLLDGEHLLEVALDAGWPLDTVALATGAGAAAVELANRADRAGATVVHVSAGVLEALSPVRAPAGVVTIATRREEATLERLLDTTAPLLVAACDVQDPGNVGAVIRSADACGATGVVCAGATADPFGWKAARGSMGSVLRLPVVRAQRAVELITTLRARGVRVVVAAGRGGTRADALDWRGPVALLVGNEGAGLPAALEALADARASVPMRAGVESLNVAVATGILLYEAQRQREPMADSR